jgi:hypothetical protein
MSDAYDHEKDDKAMLRRLSGPLPGREPGLEPHLAKYIRMSEQAPPAGVDFAEDALCRWCWRPLFLQLLADDATWNLKYEEYERTEFCDARSDGATLSQLPHEPCGAVFASVTTLIKMAARLAAVPGTMKGDAHNATLARLVCLAAGVPEEQEPWARTAIIREACKRGQDFSKAAWVTSASDWPVPS